MVLLTLVDGKKGPKDILVLLHAYGEPLTFAEWLFIGKCYLDSEASYYPIKEGYRGNAMLFLHKAFREYGLRPEIKLDTDNWDVSLRLKFYGADLIKTKDIKEDLGVK